MVLVDTSIWVDFFRSRNFAHSMELANLLRSNQVLVIGVVIGEVLQGAQSDQEFIRVRDRLLVLPYVDETAENWASAGELGYRLRRQGITIGIIDLLIATLAMEHDAEVYSLDQHFQRVPGLKHHSYPSVSTPVQ
jgi:predicted nucleic acid-binding protein